jgi:hypothetical protein
MVMAGAIRSPMRADRRVSCPRRARFHLAAGDIHRRVADARQPTGICDRHRPRVASRWCQTHGTRSRLSRARRHRRPSHTTPAQPWHWRKPRSNVTISPPCSSASVAGTRRGDENCRAGATAGRARRAAVAPPARRTHRLRRRPQVTLGILTGCDVAHRRRPRGSPRVCHPADSGAAGGRRSGPARSRRS